MKSISKEITFSGKVQIGFSPARSIVYLAVERRLNRKGYREIFTKLEKYMIIVHNTFILNRVDSAWEKYSCNQSN